MGDYTRAEPLYRRALDIMEKTLGPEHPGTATSLGNLASLYQVMGDYSRAERLSRRVLEIREKVLGPEHPDTALSLSNFAFLYGATGRPERALDYFRRSLAIEEKTIENIFSIASERQKLDFVRKTRGGYRATLSLIHRKFPADQDALRTGLDLVLSHKGIVFDAQARQGEAMARALDPETRGLWDELSTKRSVLAKLLQSGPGKLKPADYRARIEGLQKEIEALEAELSSRSALVAEELEQRRATTEKVAARLGAGMVLAEFVRIRDYDWEKGEWGSTHRYLAFVLHPDGKVSLVDLGEAGELEKRVMARLGKLREGGRLDNRGMRRQVKASEDLYTLVWEPVAGAVGGASRVVVSPDGILNVVPFGAVMDGGGRFLAEAVTITYVTSGRDLLRGGAGLKPEADLFLAADPRFDLTGKSVPVETARTVGLVRSADFSMKFEGLPGTAMEAEEIPGLLPGTGKEVVTDVDATEEAVLSARRPRVMHLATHGFFLEDQSLPEASGVKGPSDAADRLPPGYENPLVRSGLALAGANHAAQSTTGMDGLLTALEVSGMDLHGTDLVTLSACETGLGDVKDGEGVFGLRRAFALAGARGLLMSLWPVADEITARQMLTFYRLYGEGKGAAEALREAQMETIRALREKYGVAAPSLWAPFIMQGGA